MKRVMALTAIVSVLALFVLTSQASAQNPPMVTADPGAVEGPGTHTFTLTGSGWNAGLTVLIVPCVLPGDQLTTASSRSEIIAAVSGISEAACVLSPIGAPITVGDDGTFSAEVTYDIPDNFAFGVGDFGRTQESAAPILFVAEDMGDYMTPEKDLIESGLGGMAGSDGDSAAVPLAATLAAVVLLGGAALVAHRNT